MLLFGGAEIFVRAGALANPSLLTIPLPEEQEGLFRPDRILFWSMRPKINLEYRGATVKTNSDGLRTAEINPKREHEFRVLCLGESTTFGVGVKNDETYSVHLEKYLNANLDDFDYRVINGGVSAYSSFQSLKYLELFGLDFAPDLVILYHELNDYLPSSLRDSSNTEISVMKTDMQLFESKSLGISRSLLQRSALVRLLELMVARKKIQRFDKNDYQNPLESIGLPDIGISPRLVAKTKGGWKRGEVQEKALGRRVSEKEQQEIFLEFMELCETKGIGFVIIHPSYAESKRHECFLTRFCSRNKVSLFKAYDVLHPENTPPRALYLDNWHPDRMGHYLLGKQLGRFLIRNELVGPNRLNTAPSQGNSLSPPEFSAPEDIENLA